MSASLLPATTFERADAFWTTETRRQPRARVQAVLATLVPASLASALVLYAGLDPDQALADLTRDGRRALVRALTTLPLPVVEASCQYKAPARYDDVLLIRPTVSELRRVSILFTYEVVREDEPSAVLCTGRTLHACVGRDGKPKRFPDAFVRMVEQSP